MFRKIKRLLGLEPHIFVEYMLNNYMCMKCGKELYVPPHRKFRFMVMDAIRLKGCKGRKGRKEA